MTGRKAAVGVCLFCALAIGLLAAQTAGAATKGTTAFTCKSESGGAGFSKAHCKAADAVASGANFKHVSIAAGTTTETIVTNEKTNTETSGASSFKLAGVFLGTALELEATGVSGTGTLVNEIDAATGEHLAQGSASITFTGVTVTKPAGQGCEVVTDGSEGGKGAKGSFDSRKLKVTTKAQGDRLLIESEAGEPFATFWVTGCTLATALNRTYKLTGKVTGIPDGATVNFTHADTTTQGTLILEGKAGIDGSITLSGRANSGQAYTPLSFTTVETP